MELEEYRRTSLESWQTMASGWERRREEIERVTRPVSEWMVQALDPQPGDTVLELAVWGVVSIGIAMAVYFPFAKAAERKRLRTEDV